MGRQYGYIENNHLRVRNVDDTTQLSSEWKPVDKLDETQMQCEEGYIIKAYSYDAGDHISFRYEKKIDTQYLSEKIRKLKSKLAAEDYKIIKCYEASLLNQELPYDIQELHDKRQSLREQINQLEGELANA